VRIWIDADACPNSVKEILFRAAQRVQIPVILVANQAVQAPRSRWIRAVRVGAGFDVADHFIAEGLQPGDLVVTADIPLAARAVERGCEALNPRGEHYTKENIRERLAMRNFMEELRSAGVQTGGPGALSQTDRKAFADALDRLLSRQRRGSP
jgi:uncharacterized protein YaiI (UPF0178 family)